MRNAFHGETEGGQIPLVEDANFDPATKTIKRDGAAVISSFDLLKLIEDHSFKPAAAPPRKSRAGKAPWKRTVVGT